MYWLLHSLPLVAADPLKVIDVYVRSETDKCSVSAYQSIGSMGITNRGKLIQ